MHIPYLETFLWCLLERAERAEVWKLVSGKETVSSGAREQAALGGKWWDQPLKAGKLQTKCAQQYFPLCSSFILKMKIAQDKSIGLIPGTVCSLLLFPLKICGSLKRRNVQQEANANVTIFNANSLRSLSASLILHRKSVTVPWQGCQSAPPLHRRESNRGLWWFYMMRNCLVHFPASDPTSMR